MDLKNRRSIRAVLVAVLAGLLVVGAAPTSWAGSHPEHPHPTRPGRTLVAMGDSFASGEGTFDYLPGTDTADNRCHRSDLAYGALLDRIPGVGPTRLVACSGSTTADLLRPNDEFDEPAQVDALSRRTRYVTLTTGGNDIGFSTLVGACLLAATKNQSCAADPRLQALIDGGLAGLSGAVDTTPAVYPLTRVLAEIDRRAPRADIVVTGYPELFGSDPADATPAPAAPGGAVCVLDPAAGLAVTYADTQWLNAQTRRLNAVLAAAVRSARDDGLRVRFANPVRAFEGHGRCDSRTAWINPVQLIDPATSTVSRESLHPTKRGQLAYLTAVLTSALR